MAARCPRGLVNVHIHDVPREYQVKRPIGNHPKLALHSRDLHKIERPVHPPRDKARKVQAQRFGGGGETAQRHEHPPALVPKRLRRLAPYRGEYILRRRSRLPPRELRRRRTRPPAQHIRHIRAVPHRPQIGYPLNRQRIVNHQPPALPLARHARQHRVRRGAYRGDQRIRGNEHIIGKHRRLRRGAHQLRVQPYGDAPLLKQSMAERRQPLPKLRQNPRRAMQQNNPEIIRPDIAVALACHPQKFVDLSGNLHARIAAARYHERQRAPLEKRVILHIRRLQHLDKMASQPQRVAQRLERQRMLLHAGKLRQIRGAPHREHQVIVVNMRQPRVVRVAYGDIVVRGIHILYLGLMNLRVRNQPPYWADHIGRADRAGYYLRQHRLQQKEILPAD